MMFSASVPVQQVGDRLDAEYYDPVALNLDALVRTGAATTLGACVRDGRYGIIKDTTEAVGPDGVPLLAPTDVDGLGAYEFEHIEARVPATYRKKAPAAIAVADELLIEAKGNTAKVAVVPASDAGRMLVSGSFFKAKLNDGCEPRFMQAFLSSRIGQTLKRRVVSNINISYLGKEDLFALPVPCPHPAAQEYIGAKVRQAEALRKWARLEQQVVNTALDGVLPGLPSRPTIWNRVTASDLDDRLDPRPYRSHRLQLRTVLQAMSTSRVDVLAQVKGGNPVPSDIFVPDGVPLIKNGDIKPDGFKRPTTNSVTREFHDSNPQYWAREGMVVVSLDGDIRAQCFLSEDLPAHVNQRVAMMTVHGMPPALLAAWINHPIVQEQMHSWSVQTTVEHISNAIVEGSLVPRFSETEEARLGRAASSARRARHFARALVTGAGLLVEALIERKVTEAELIAAGKDSEADRTLLSLLRADGIDGSGALLFPDLGALSELLAAVAGGGVA